MVNADVSRGLRPGDTLTCRGREYASHGHIGWEQGAKHDREYAADPVFAPGGGKMIVRICCTD
ncbi:hypothetical protein [Amycolatopsis sp. NPDC004079]|uniref:hypothetical protein n=1 Tax=Amycolatopsis sp. NPDC004079 TaxID=3154549 RepID=UPI0033BAE955